MEIVKYRPLNKGNLQAFFDLKIPKWGNFIIHDMSYFTKGDQRWIGFPSRPYESEGKTKYARYCNFETDDMTKKFSTLVLKAIDDYLKEHEPSALSTNVGPTTAEQQLDLFF